MANQRKARAATQGRVTENKLVHGWASAPKMRIRRAVAADIATVGTMAAIAEVPFNAPLREAMRVPVRKLREGV